jgi:hypothetical protein
MADAIRTKSRWQLYGEKILHHINFELKSSCSIGKEYFTFLLLAHSLQAVGNAEEILFHTPASVKQQSPLCFRVGFVV